ncbi:hypothetical protein NTJ12_002616 [Flavobacterium psychrophilum]|nr:hypothetical protein [Flavobacterium psychrophilum]
MKLTKYIIFFIFFAKSCFAQPGVKPNVTIDIQTMFANGKQIFAKGDGSIQNNTIYLSNKKGLKDVWTHTAGNVDEENDIFIYKKDTMRVKIVLPKHYDLGYIRIRKFNFKKGNFTIDFLEYITKTKKQIIYNSYEVDNFPEDCITYRKENQTKK